MTALHILLAAVNAWLAVTGATYRVDSLIATTSRDGVTMIALRETRDAVDWRGGVNQPIVNL